MQQVVRTAEWVSSIRVLLLMAWSMIDGVQTDELKKNTVAKGRLEGGKNGGGEMDTRQIQRLVAAMPQYR